jgi:hypothetical protein
MPCHLPGSPPLRPPGIAVWQQFDGTVSNGYAPQTTASVVQKVMRSPAHHLLAPTLHTSSADRCNRSGCRSGRSPHMNGARSRIAMCGHARETTVQVVNKLISRIHDCCIGGLPARGRQGVRWRSGIIPQLPQCHHRARGSVTEPSAPGCELNPPCHGFQRVQIQSTYLGDSGEREADVCRSAMSG